MPPRPVVSGGARSSGARGGACGTDAERWAEGSPAAEPRGVRSARGPDLAPERPWLSRAAEVARDGLERRPSSARGRQRRARWESALTEAVASPEGVVGGAAPRPKCRSVVPCVAGWPRPPSAALLGCAVAAGGFIVGSIADPFGDDPQAASTQPPDARLVGGSTACASGCATSSPSRPRRRRSRPRPARAGHGARPRGAQS